MAVSSAISPSSRARGVGIKTEFRDLSGGRVFLLPQQVAIVGLGNTASTYATTKKTILTAGEAGAAYGYGSPIHLAAKQLLPVNGDGVGTIPVTVYPLQQDGSGVAATGEVTHSGTPTAGASYKVRVGGLDSDEFAIVVGDTPTTVHTKMAAAINAIIDLPVTAVAAVGEVTLTCKWKGTLSNFLDIEVLGSTAVGNSFAVTAMNGGLINPDVQPALDAFGDRWETIIVNTFEHSDTTILDAIATFGEGRWGALTRKPLVALHGNTVVDPTTATTVSDARKTDRVNGFIPAPGSPMAPFIIAARAVSRIAVRANENPAYDYGRLPLSGLIAGEDGDQWDYAARDLAFKRGGSSSRVQDGVINLADVLTFWNPEEEIIGAYTHVVDIVKLQNILFNADLIFDSAQWDGVPLIPDGQPTTNPDAKSPSDAKAFLARLADNLGLEAIISDPGYSKANTVSEISSTNPKRLDVCFPVKISGNANIISADLKFGFFFG